MYFIIQILKQKNNESVWVQFTTGFRTMNSRLHFETRRVTVTWNPRPVRKILVVLYSYIECESLLLSNKKIKILVGKIQILVGKIN